MKMILILLMEYIKLLHWHLLIQKTLLKHLSNLVYILAINFNLC